MQQVTLQVFKFLDFADQMQRGYPVSILPAVCVSSLTSFYTRGPQDFENVKETIVQILNVCGVYAATAPLASFAVALVQCWTMYEMQIPEPDVRITVASLGVRTRPFPRPFSHLALSLGGANDVARLEHAACKASETLCAWQWDESVDLPEDLVDTMNDVKLALEDVVFILRATKLKMT